MLKKIVKKTLFVFLTVFGLFLVYGEIIIRIFRGTERASWAYDIYYIIPIRAHGFVAKICFWFVVYLLSEVTKKLSTRKVILLIIYIAYILLFFNTLRGM